MVSKAKDIGQLGIMIGYGSTLWYPAHLKSCQKIAMGSSKQEAKGHLVLTTSCWLDVHPRTGLDIQGEPLGPDHTRNLRTICPLHTTLVIYAYIYITAYIYIYNYIYTSISIPVYLSQYIESYPTKFHCIHIYVIIYIHPHLVLVWSPLWLLQRPKRFTRCFSKPSESKQTLSSVSSKRGASCGSTNLGEKKLCRHSKGALKCDENNEKMSYNWD
jgi:hypothetical protein